MLRIQNFAATFVIVLRIFLLLMFVASVSCRELFFVFLSVSQIVSETLIKTYFCHLSFTRLWSAALSQNSPLLNIKIRNRTGTCNKNWEKNLLFPFSCSQACVHPMLLYVRSVFTLASYMQRCVNIKIIKIMNANVFHHIGLCGTSLYVYLLRQRTPHSIQYTKSALCTNR